MAQPVLEALPAAQRVDLMGQPLRVAAACIRLANFYVGNDSGLMHIAAAAGTPTLGLFGPSSETRYGPWGEHCAAVRTPEAFKEIVMADGFDYTSQRSLMESLTVDSAYAALEKLYASVKNTPERNHVTAQRYCRTTPRKPAGGNPASGAGFVSAQGLLKYLVGRYRPRGWDQARRATLFS